MVDVLIVVVCCAFTRQNIFCLDFGEIRKKGIRILEGIRNGLT